MKPHAPALPNDDAFFNRFFAEVGSYRDTVGRPLHEVDFRAEESPQAFKACPFHDSRAGTLINNQALRQIMQDWREVERGLSFFAQSEALSVRGAQDLLNAWRVSLATIFAPLYLVHRKEQALASGEIPTVVSGLFKIMLDVPTTLDLMFFAMPQKMQSLQGKDAARSIYAYANESSILVNGAYSCAGAPNLIDAIAMRLVCATGETSEAWRALFPDWGHFSRFSALMTAQYAVSLIYQAALAVSMEDLCAHAGVQHASPQMPLAAYERRRRIVLSHWKDAAHWTPTLSCIQHAVCEGLLDMQARIEPVFTATQRYLHAARGAGLAEVSFLHEEYHALVEDCIQALQNDIHRHLQTESLFKEPVGFTRKRQDHPLNVIRQTHPFAAEAVKKVRA